MEEGEHIRNPEAQHQQPITHKVSITNTEGREARTPFVRVRENIEYWKDMNQADFAVKLISRGLTIPFVNKRKVQKLCTTRIKERDMSKAKKGCLLKEIDELLEMGVIEIVPPGRKVYENYIFCIQKPSGKKRVIFDMKKLNVQIKLPKLKMFKFSFAYEDLIKNSWACKIDLSNAYWHIAVNINFRHYLAFKFNGKTYQWKAMPFGLKTAPYLFCKLMGIFVKHIRMKFNIILFYYMDDIFIVGPSLEETRLQTRRVVSELQAAGFTVNFEKSKLEPVQIIEFIGVKIDLRLKVLAPSEDNIKACIKKVKKFKSHKVEKLVNLQSVIGSLNFVASFIKFGRIKLAPLFAFVPYFSNEIYKWVPTQLKEDLNWWLIESNYSEVKIPDFNREVVKIFTDASSQGWGAQIVWQDNSKLSMNGVWSEEDSQLHINIKELKAVWISLCTDTFRYSNVVLKIFSDNKSTVQWLKKGTASRSLEARKVLVEILKLKYKWNLVWSSVYIKGCNNVIADSLSRSLSFNAETALTSQCFIKLCNIANCQPEIDLFADNVNAKCKVFFSASPVPGAMGCDALRQNWDSFRCVYAFPPSHLINKTLYKFTISNCFKLLLVFHRESARMCRTLDRLGAVQLRYRFQIQDILVPRGMKDEAIDPSGLIAYVI